MLSVEDHNALGVDTDPQPTTINRCWSVNAKGCKVAEEFCCTLYSRTETPNEEKKGVKKMASVKKFTHTAVRNQLRHIYREIQNNANEDIDQSRTEQNYSLIQRDISDYDYYLKRKSELYCYNRSDTKTCAGWVISAPKNLDQSQQKEFFQCVHNFLVEKYSEENVISSVCHLDEETPHLHFLFMGVVQDTKHAEFEEKLCMSAILTRSSLRNFHPELQSYLNKNLDFHAPVHSGITQKNGGNRTVAEMKQERKIQHNYNVGRW